MRDADLVVSRMAEICLRVSRAVRATQGWPSAGQLPRAGVYLGLGTTLALRAAEKDVPLQRNRTPQRRGGKRGTWAGVDARRGL